MGGGVGGRSMDRGGVTVVGRLKRMSGCAPGNET